MLHTSCDVCVSIRCLDGVGEIPIPLALKRTRFLKIANVFNAISKRLQLEMSVVSIVFIHIGTQLKAIIVLRRRQSNRNLTNDFIQRKCKRHVRDQNRLLCSLRSKSIFALKLYHDHNKLSCCSTKTRVSSDRLYIHVLLGVLRL